jgi:hypothetical protein
MQAVRNLQAKLPLRLLLLAPSRFVLPQRLMNLSRQVQRPPGSEYRHRLMVGFQFHMTKG